MKKLIVLASLLAVSSLAFANNDGNGDNHSHGNGDDRTHVNGGGAGGAGGSAVSSNTNDVSNTNSLSNAQAQKQGQQQSSSNTNSNTANGGSVSNSGNSSVSNTGNSTSNSGGNVQNTVYEQVRQAPSVAQGSFAISGCGVAGNVGGSNSHGAAFLGVGFTTDECYLFIQAQAYQAVGQTKAACEVLNHTKAAERLVKKGMMLPLCEQPAPVVVTEKAPASPPVVVVVHDVEKVSAPVPTQEPLFEQKREPLAQLVTPKKSHHAAPAKKDCADPADKK